MNENSAFAALLEQVERWRHKGERIGLCHGCFDLLHVGHLHHFKAARILCDRLVVTITPDRFVNKGQDRPVFPASLRLEMVQALKVVDAAAINMWDTAVETIRQVRPHAFAKGSEYRDRSRCNPNFFLEAEAMRSIGGELVFTDELTFSSTSLIQSLKTC